jgi:hypothetical protein
MNTLQKFTSAAAVGCLLLASPASAAPDNTLGMALMSAVVNANGTLDRGSGVASSLRLGAAGSGTYEVLFDREVSTCTFVASLGNSTFTTFLGEVSAVRRSGAGKENGVYVETNNSAGASADKPFHLIVFCAK